MMPSLALRRGRRAAALAAALWLGACGGAGEAEEGVPPAAEGPSAGVVADTMPFTPQAESAVPVAAWTPADSARAAQEDSIQELRLLRTRQANMDSYEECMAKTRGADPQQRAVLEAACGRGRATAP